VFDGAMETRVRKLQQGFGIPADGIVGPETLFALSSLDDAGPHLARNVD
jgi:general secretion pathway protein A